MAYKVQMVSVTQAIKKHGFSYKLTFEAYGFLLGLIVEANSQGFPQALDFSPRELIGLGLAKTPNEVYSRRRALCRIEINGIPLLTGDPSHYEFNWDLLIGVNDVWESQKGNGKETERAAERVAERKQTQQPYEASVEKNKEQKGSQKGNGKETGNTTYSKKRIFNRARTREGENFNADLSPKTFYNYGESFDWGVLNTKTDWDRAHRRFSALMERRGMWVKVQHSDGREVFDGLVVSYGEETLLEWLQEAQEKDQVGSRLPEFLTAKGTGYG